VVAFAPSREKPVVRRGVVWLSGAIRAVVQQIQTLMAS
jgi:hypothetical protein